MTNPVLRDVALAVRAQDTLGAVRVSASDIDPDYLHLAPEAVYRKLITHAASILRCAEAIRPDFELVTTPRQIAAAGGEQ